MKMIFAEPMIAENPAIDICYLRVDYGNFVAVDDLTLSVPRGEVFGLVGPNGAGNRSQRRERAAKCLEEVSLTDQRNKWCKELSELPAQATRAVPRAFYFWLWVSVLVALWRIYRLWADRRAMAKTFTDRYIHGGKRDDLPR